MNVYFWRQAGVMREVRVKTKSMVIKDIFLIHQQLVSNIFYLFKITIYYPLEQKKYIGC